VNIKSQIQSQYHASLGMLRQVVEKFPEQEWDAPGDKNKAWQIAYHAVFYAHFYLHPKEEDFEPWPKHRREAVSFDSPKEGQAPQPFSKAEVLEYLEIFSQRVDPMVDALDLDAQSGFSWLPFNKLELQFYNIRHVMLHTGELAERLWVVAGEEVHWIGRRPKER